MCIDASVKCNSEGVQVDHEIKCTKVFNFKGGRTQKITLQTHLDGVEISSIFLSLETQQCDVDARRLGILSEMNKSLLLRETNHK